MSRERFTDEATSEALSRLRTDVRPLFSHYSLPLEVSFPASTFRRDVAHGLGEIPTGMLVIYADATITAEQGVFWTEHFAYLRSSSAPARARIIFVVTNEEPLRA